MGDLPHNIGKYQIKSSLGEGAMGAVYEGFDPDIERRVAIKVLHPHLITEKTAPSFWNVLSARPNQLLDAPIRM